MDHDPPGVDRPGSDRDIPDLPNERLQRRSRRKYRYSNHNTQPHRYEHALADADGHPNSLAHPDADAYHDPVAHTDSNHDGHAELLAIHAGQFQQVV